LNDDHVLARGEGYKTAYDLSPSNYRMAEIEVPNRSFAEGARYYREFAGLNGIKHVGKPEGIAQIRDLIGE
jgi:hypothetical protein